MSFGSEDGKTGSSFDDESARPKPTAKVNWLRGGILTILFSTGNLIFYQQTGRSLVGRHAGAAPTIVFCVGGILFGVFAIIMHIRKTS